MESEEWENLAKESLSIVANSHDEEAEEFRDEFDFEKFDEVEKSSDLGDEYLDSDEKFQEFRSMASDKRSLFKDTQVFKEYRAKKLTQRKKIYDSLPLLDDQKFLFKVDSNYVDYVKERIYESKLTFGSGLVIKMENLSEIEGKNLTQLMKSSIKIGLLTEGGS